jgi:hypothetical protein
MTTTATKFKSVTLDTPEYAVKMTRDTFKEVFGGEPRDIHFPFPIFESLVAPCIKRHWKRNSYYNDVVAVTFYGDRSLYRLKQEGYNLSGKCKVEGKEVNGYTSDIMVEIEGNLYSIAVIAIRD